MVEVEKKHMIKYFKFNILSIIYLYVVFFLRFRPMKFQLLINANKKLNVKTKYLHSGVY